MYAIIDDAGAWRHVHYTSADITAILAAKPVFPGTIIVNGVLGETRIPIDYIDCGPGSYCTQHVD